MSGAADAVRAYIEPFSGSRFMPVVDELAGAYENGGIEEVRRLYPNVIDLVDPDIHREAEPVGRIVWQRTC